MATFEVEKGKFKMTTTSAVEAETLRAQGYTVRQKPETKPASKDTK